MEASARKHWERGAGAEALDGEIGMEVSGGGVG